MEDFYIEKTTSGEVVRFNTNKKYTKDELKKQREDFSKLANSGKQICLTDLMINHGM